MGGDNASDVAMTERFGVRGRRLAAAIAVGAVFGLLAPVLIFGRAAQADTGGYPEASMPCEWFPQASSGPAHTAWCQDFDWGPTPSTLFAGQESIDESTTISPRGFGYRNCTDYVAFKLGFDARTVHGNAAQWKAQIAGSNVTAYPSVGAVAWWGPELFGGLGHVGVVLSLQPNGGALVGEYNYFKDGTYDTRVIPTHGADAFLHIRDQAVPGGHSFPPPAPPPPPKPTPRPSPTPPPVAHAPSPASVPAPTPTPGPSPSPPAQDRTRLAQALGTAARSYVSFDPTRVLHPGAPALVEASVAKADALTEALDRQLAAAGAPPLKEGDLVRATLSGPGFRIDPTSPPDQVVVGTSGAVWQWSVTPLRPGRPVLTLCLAVESFESGGIEASAPSCTTRRTVRVTRLPAFLVPILGSSGAAAAWSIAAVLVLLVVAAAVAWGRRGRTARHGA